MTKGESRDRARRGLLSPKRERGNQQTSRKFVCFLARQLVASAAGRSGAARSGVTGQSAPACPGVARGGERFAQQLAQKLSSPERVPRNNEGRRPLEIVSGVT